MAARAETGSGFPRPPSTGSAAGISGTSTTTKTAWPTSRFPKEVREDLIRSGRVIPHPAFPDSRTDASYQVRGPEDVPGAVELFRINYERAVARDARHAARTKAATRKEAT